MLKKSTSYPFFFLIGLMTCFTVHANTLTFSNLKWEVRDGYGGPGPNLWSHNNAWVDENGWLHLSITKVNKKWYCADVVTTANLGFGKYWFYVVGRVDKLDPHVVLGLFNYPPKNIGPDGTNEIDIEFSKWGSGSKTDHNISYTVWPNQLSLNNTSLIYTLNLTNNLSTHGFSWKKDKIYYQSGLGHDSNYLSPIMNWLFMPADFDNRIPQSPMPIHITLSLVKGEAPVNGKAVEIIIKQFCYISLDNQIDNCNVLKK